MGSVFGLELKIDVTTLRNNGHLFGFSPDRGAELSTRQCDNFSSILTTMCPPKDQVRAMNPNQCVSKEKNISENR